MINSLSLRTFSRLKLQEAFKKAGKEDRIEAFVDDIEALTLTCSFLRLVSNAGIILLLAVLFWQKHLFFAFAAAVVLLELFNLFIPHAWAKHTGEFVLSHTFGLLFFLRFLMRPVLKVFELHDHFVKRLAGVAEVDIEQAQEDKQEEIMSYIEQGTLEGLVDEDEMEMIENVFELGDTTAEEIMTPRTDLVAIPVSADLLSIIQTMRQTGHSRYPVYEETVDKIIGLLYAKDLLSEVGKTSDDFQLRDMLRAAFFVPESKPLTDLLHEFQNQKLHIAVVLDEYGGTAGIVTIEDILEELVGEITDEYEKTPEASYRQVDEMTYEIDARMYIDDVNSELELGLSEDDDYDTLGGFVFSHLGQVPKVGQVFDFEGKRFKVTSADPRTVKRVRIQVVDPDWSQKTNQ